MPRPPSESPNSSSSSPPRRPSGPATAAPRDGAPGLAVPDPGDLVQVGRVTGAFGVLGWVRVVSWCEPPDNLLTYSPWYLRLRDEWTVCRLEEGRGHGKGVVARLEGCNDRDQAQALGGAAVAVRRSQLPDPGTGEFYWADLIGLRVVGAGGRDLGRVSGLIETGANDVLVVQGDRERLIPYLPGQVVLEVDLDAKRIRVDWDPDF